MKKFKTLFIAAILTLGMSVVSNAQSKIAHISTDELISLMPETKSLDAELTKLKNTYDNDLKALETRLKTKFSKYQSEAASQNEEENRKRAVELQKEEQQMYSEIQKAEQELVKKRNERLKPIIDKARKAIQDVANSKGIEYVMDSANLLVAKGVDLLPAVKAKLGI